MFPTVEVKLPLPNLRSVQFVMSAIQNPPSNSQIESKSAKKKKAKAEAAAQTPAVASEPEATAGQTAIDGGTNGVDSSNESPYLKELYK